MCANFFSIFTNLSRIWILYRTHTHIYVAFFIFSSERHFILTRMTQKLDAYERTHVVETNAAARVSDEGESADKAFEGPHCFYIVAARVSKCVKGA